MEETRPGTRILVVSGSHKRVGKTLLIERLLPLLGRAAAVKLSSQPAHDDHGEGPDCDTSRYRAAGAEETLYLRCTDDESLGPLRDLILSGRFDTVCVETNRFSSAIDADIRFFVKGNGTLKDNAPACEAQADIVVAELT